MNTETGLKIKKRIRVLLVLFITGLILSGITAFPLEWEMKFFHGFGGILPTSLQDWYNRVWEGVRETNSAYPFMAYGTDWLAFAHIIIALFFYAPLRDPLRYALIIDIGIAACILVFPLALICGPLRGIPFFWQLIDCSFGIGGLVFLTIIRRSIRQLQTLHNLNP
jgi:hypothetical protein